jgi:2Fe-2S ferredoxin
MSALLAAGIPVASSCLGKGVCSKCRLVITSNPENLSQETPAEADLRKRNHISEDSRISCQALVLGDVEVDASYW